MLATLYFSAIIIFVCYSVECGARVLPQVDGVWSTDDRPKSGFTTRDLNVPRSHLGHRTGRLFRQNTGEIVRRWRTIEREEVRPSAVGNRLLTGRTNCSLNKQLLSRLETYIPEREMRRPFVDEKEGRTRSRYAREVTSCATEPTVLIKVEVVTPEPYIMAANLRTTILFVYSTPSTLKCASGPQSGITQSNKSVALPPHTGPFQIKGAEQKTPSLPETSITNFYTATSALPETLKTNNYTGLTTLSETFKPNKEMAMTTLQGTCKTNKGMEVALVTIGNTTLNSMLTTQPGTSCITTKPFTVFTTPSCERVKETAVTAATPVAAAGSSSKAKATTLNPKYTMKTTTTKSGTAKQVAKQTTAKLTTKRSSSTKLQTTKGTSGKLKTTKSTATKSVATKAAAATKCTEAKGTAMKATSMKATSMKVTTMKVTTMKGIKSKSTAFVPMKTSCAVSPVTQVGPVSQVTPARAVAPTPAATPAPAVVGSTICQTIATNVNALQQPITQIKQEALKATTTQTMSMSEAKRLKNAEENIMKCMEALKKIADNMECKSTTQKEECHKAKHTKKKIHATVAHVPTRTLVYLEMPPTNLPNLGKPQLWAVWNVSTKGSMWKKLKRPEKTTTSNYEDVEVTTIEKKKKKHQKTNTEENTCETTNKKKQKTTTTTPCKPATTTKCTTKRTKAAKAPKTTTCVPSTITCSTSHHKKRSRKHKHHRRHHHRGGTTTTTCVGDSPEVQRYRKTVEFLGGPSHTVDNWAAITEYSNLFGRMEPPDVHVIEDLFNVLVANGTPWSDLEENVNKYQSTGIMSNLLFVVPGTTERIVTLDPWLRKYKNSQIIQWPNDISANVTTNWLNFLHPTVSALNWFHVSPNNASLSEPSPHNSYNTITRLPGLNQYEISVIDNETSNSLPKFPLMTSGNHWYAIINKDPFGCTSTHSRTTSTRPLTDSLIMVVDDGNVFKHPTTNIDSASSATGRIANYLPQYSSTVDVLHSKASQNDLFNISALNGNTDAHPLRVMGMLAPKWRQIYANPLVLSLLNDVSKGIVKQQDDFLIEECCNHTKACPCMMLSALVKLATYCTSQTTTTPCSVITTQRSTCTTTCTTKSTCTQRSTTETCTPSSTASTCTQTSTASTCTQTSTDSTCTQTSTDSTCSQTSETSTCSQISTASTCLQSSTCAEPSTTEKAEQTSVLDLIQMKVLNTLNNVKCSSDKPQLEETEPEKSSSGETTSTISTVCESTRTSTGQCERQVSTLGLPRLKSKEPCCENIHSETTESTTLSLSLGIVKKQKCFQSSASTTGICKSESSTPCLLKALETTTKCITVPVTIFLPAAKRYTNALYIQPTTQPQMEEVTTETSTMDLFQPKLFQTPITFDKNCVLGVTSPCPSRHWVSKPTTKCFLQAGTKNSFYVPGVRKVMNIPNIQQVTQPLITEATLESQIVKSVRTNVLLSQIPMADGDKPQASTQSFTQQMELEGKSPLSAQIVPLNTFNRLIPKIDNYELQYLVTALVKKTNVMSEASTWALDLPTVNEVTLTYPQGVGYLFNSPSAAQTLRIKSANSRYSRLSTQKTSAPKALTAFLSNPPGAKLGANLNEHISERLFASTNVLAPEASVKRVGVSKNIPETQPYPITHSRRPVSFSTRVTAFKLGSRPNTSSANQVYQVPIGTTMSGLLVPQSMKATPMLQCSTRTICSINDNKLTVMKCDQSLRGRSLLPQRLKTTCAASQTKFVRRTLSPTPYRPIIIIYNPPTKTTTQEVTDTTQEEERTEEQEVTTEEPPSETSPTTCPTTEVTCTTTCPTTKSTCPTTKSTCRTTKSTCRTTKSTCRTTKSKSTCPTTKSTCRTTKSTCRTTKSKSTCPTTKSTCTTTCPTTKSTCTTTCPTTKSTCTTTCPTTESTCTTTCPTTNSTFITTTEPTMTMNVTDLISGETTSYIRPNLTIQETTVAKNPPGEIHFPTIRKGIMTSGDAHGASQGQQCVPTSTMAYLLVNRTLQSGNSTNVLLICGTAKIDIVPSKDLHTMEAMQETMTEAMSTIPMSTIPMSTIPMSTIPMSTIPISAIPMSTIPMSTIPMSTIPMSTPSVISETFSTNYMNSFLTTREHLNMTEPSQTSTVHYEMTEKAIGRTEITSKHSVPLNNAPAPPLECVSHTASEPNGLLTASGSLTRAMCSRSSSMMSKVSQLNVLSLEATPSAAPFSSSFTIGTGRAHLMSHSILSSQLATRHKESTTMAGSAVERSADNRDSVTNAVENRPSSHFILNVSQLLTASTDSAPLKLASVNYSEHASSIQTGNKTTTRKSYVLSFWKVSKNNVSNSGEAGTLQKRVKSTASSRASTSRYTNSVSTQTNVHSVGHTGVTTYTLQSQNIKNTVEKTVTPTHAANVENKIPTLFGTVISGGNLRRKLKSHGDSTVAEMLGHEVNALKEYGTSPRSHEGSETLCIPVHDQGSVTIIKGIHKSPDTGLLHWLFPLKHQTSSYAERTFSDEIKKKNCYFPKHQPPTKGLTYR